MKKWICMLLALATACSLAGCNSEIEATVQPFPDFEAVDFAGTPLSNEMFAEYDATIINFWTNGCGSCIEEMPDLEEYAKQFKEQNINLISVAVSAAESEEERAKAENILKEKGVTYQNLIPDAESAFYKEFIGDIAGYPMTYIVDSKGNMIGAPIVGVVKNQEDTLKKRLDMI